MRPTEATVRLRPIIDGKSQPEDVTLPLGIINNSSFQTGWERAEANQNCENLPKGQNKKQAEVAWCARRDCPVRMTKEQLYKLFKLKFPPTTPPEVVSPEIQARRVELEKKVTVARQTLKAAEDKLAVFLKEHSISNAAGNGGDNQ
jgi:hypothetical protein